MRPVMLSILLICGSAIPASAQQLKAITNSIGMKLVLILPGSFRMGSPDEEKERLNNETQHLVTISRWFYIGAYEVTQGEYERVMGNNPSGCKGAENPAEMVSWADAISFCKKLSELSEEKAAGREYRLPTEAEWEYACRATSGATYCFGDSVESLGEYAWSHENSERKIHPVGEKKANRWGLYDMHGNVWEWCQDCSADYPPDASTDPQGPNKGSDRILRGGCSGSDAALCRSAFRGLPAPPLRAGNIGFRVAMSLPAKQPEAASTK